MNKALRKRLVEIATAQKVVCYSQVAPLVGLDMGSPYDRVEIGRLLGEISEYEHQEGRPLLSAVAISLGGNKPGEGFFGLACKLRLYDGKDKDTFWTSELKRVHAAWKKSKPK